MVEFEDFKKLELRVGEIESAEAVLGSDKLVKLMVDIGTEKKQILAGIAKQYSPADLVGRQIIIVANLAPRMMAGLESQGMLLAAHNTEGGAVLLVPDKEVAPGSQIT
ncbi:MAG: methionine--tRNA ligase subunit beta [Patescibacteria group bacterium]